MSAIDLGPSISKQGLVLCLDAGNNKSYSVNRFQSYGTGLVTENVTFAINGTGTFQRVAAGTVIGGYTVKPNDVVYSYALGGTGCHYHGNGAPVLAGSYATFSFDYLVTGATTYPITDYLANFEGVANGSVATANSLQNIWQRRTFTVGPISSSGNLNMYLYPGACSSSRLADSGTIYYRNPKVEFTNTDTGNSTFSASNSITTWRDVSVNGNNGTLTNDPTSNVSNGGSLAFDGTNDYIDCGNGSSLNFGTENFTVEIWARRTTNATTNLRLLSKAADGNTASSAGFCFFGSDTGLNFAINPSTTRTIISAATYSVNEWFQVVGLIERGATMRTYKNATLVQSTAAPTGSVSNASFNLNIGRSSESSSLYWPGNVALVRIYNKALTAAEISANYNSIKNRFGL